MTTGAVKTAVYDLYPLVATGPRAHRAAIGSQKAAWFFAPISMASGLEAAGVTFPTSSASGEAAPPTVATSAPSTSLSKILAQSKIALGLAAVAAAAVLVMLALAARRSRRLDRRRAMPAALARLETVAGRARGTGLGSAALATSGAGLRPAVPAARAEAGPAKATGTARVKPPSQATSASRRTPGRPRCPRRRSAERPHRRAPRRARAVSARSARWSVRLWPVGWPVGWPVASWSIRLERPERHRWDRGRPSHWAADRPGHGSDVPAPVRGVPTNRAVPPRRWIIPAATADHRRSAPRRSSRSVRRGARGDWAPAETGARGDCGRDRGRDGACRHDGRDGHGRGERAGDRHGQGHPGRGPSDRSCASATSARGRRRRAAARPPVRDAARNHGRRSVHPSLPSPKPGRPRQNRRRRDRCG